MNYIFNNCAHILTSIYFLGIFVDKAIKKSNQCEILKGIPRVHNLLALQQNKTLKVLYKYYFCSHTVKMAVVVKVPLVKKKITCLLKVIKKLQRKKKSGYPLQHYSVPNKTDHTMVVCTYL